MIFCKIAEKRGVFIIIIALFRIFAHNFAVVANVFELRHAFHVVVRHERMLHA